VKDGNAPRYRLAGPLHSMTAAKSLTSTGKRPGLESLQNIGVSESGRHGTLQPGGEPAPRVPMQTERLVRDTRIVRHLKALYSNTCQLCGIRLKLSPSRFYSEGHHLRPLGRPHEGPDALENVIIVCANCHAQLDLGATALKRETLTIHPEHQLADEFIHYHNQLARSRMAT
jgi:predicted restriction endonuclease